MLAKHLLLFRAVLAETLLLHYLHSGRFTVDGVEAWLLFGLYAAAALSLYWLGARRILASWAAAGAFVVDIAFTSTVLFFTQGFQSDFYVAYFLVILGACFLNRLSLSFLVGGLACLVYGYFSFPGWEAALSPFYLLRLSLLLVVAFFSGAVADHARRVEGITAERFGERIAWMQRLSAVGKAMAGVLHEAKTPLSTIMLTAEYAKGRLEDRAEVGRLLDEMREEAQRACSILTDFLEFSRPAELSLERLALSDVLDRVSKRFRVRFMDREIDERREVDAPLEVYGSGKHLAQVFNNLYLNAVEAMPTGGLLRVTARRRGADAVVTISDNGVGIEASRLAGLFEPFETSKAAAGGAGLGLSVARWVLQKHGGALTIESEGLRKGTRVAVSLPIAR